jgi:hypothetical protein
MKCIKCGTENNSRDSRAHGGRCKKCNHQFVFTPIAMTGFQITDTMFAKAIADISVNNTLFFTLKQLSYSLSKRTKPKTYSAFYTTSTYITTDIVNNGHNWKLLGAMVLVIGIIISLLLNSSLVFLCTCALGLISIYLGRPKLIKKRHQYVKKIPKKTQSLLIDLHGDQYWINKWTAINPIPKMLPPPCDTNENATVNPDVSAYSFDRLVVCDRPEIAQFLIANNFHFENNCAVLSITGYPQSIFDTTMQMLRRNPDLKVYALHDCSPKGIGLVDHLRTSFNWFPDNSAIIIDIGLLPRQIIEVGDSMFVINSKSAARDAVQLSSAIRQGLSAEELEWLELGNYVELESFSPQKLIQILNRGIASSRDLDSDDSSLILLGGVDNSIYVVDSFG